MQDQKKEVDDKKQKKAEQVTHAHHFDEDNDNNNSHMTLKEKPMKTMVLMEKLPNDNHTSVRDSLTFTQAARKAGGGEGKGVAEAIQEETTSSSDNNRKE